jgi:hypothetical protein
VARAVEPKTTASASDAVEGYVQIGRLKYLLKD